MSSLSAITVPSITDQEQFRSMVRATKEGSEERWTAYDKRNKQVISQISELAKKGFFMLALLSVSEIANDNPEDRLMAGKCFQDQQQTLLEIAVELERQGLSEEAEAVANAITGILIIEKTDRLILERARKGNILGAKNLLGKRGCKNCGCLLPIAQALISSGDLDQAVAVARIIKSGLSRHSTWIHVVRAYVDKDKCEEAEALQIEAKLDSLSNDLCFEAVVRGYAIRGNTGKAMELVNKISDGWSRTLALREITMREKPSERSLD